MRHSTFRPSSRSRLTRIAAALFCALLVATAGVSHADGNFGDVAIDGGLGIGAVVGTLIYAPCKLTLALFGVPTAGLAWAFSGGNADVARSVIEPAIYGDYVLTPDHLRDPRTIEFFGRRPDDGASTAGDGEVWAAETAPPQVSAPPPSGLEAGGEIDCDAVSSLPTVHFALEQSRIDAAAATTLDRVATLLESCPQLGVDIQAHADSTGPDVLNDRLSADRAAAVRSYLSGQGVDADRLAARSFGSSQPVASNDTSKGRALNRRADLPLR